MEVMKDQIAYCYYFEVNYFRNGWDSDYSNYSDYKVILEVAGSKCFFALGVVTIDIIAWLGILASKVDEPDGTDK